ncbi:MAG TPA: sel1 repeat family protein, partial [Gammaproteobacteria bacterium]|nr:sel1 repeat family protein [Gammaproteobacteria bacterium]
SQFNLGVMLAYGNGTRKDVPAALTLWQKAARQGNANAIRTLAQVYRKGLLGIPANPGKAAYWEKRAQQGPH